MFYNLISEEDIICDEKQQHGNEIKNIFKIVYASPTKKQSKQNFTI